MPENPAATLYGIEFGLTVAFARIDAEAKRLWQPNSNSHGVKS